MNKDATNPAAPVAVEDVIYGKNDWPSNNTEDALPNDVDTSEPDTKSIRSCSIIELAKC